MSELLQRRLAEGGTPDRRRHGRWRWKVALVSALVVIATVLVACAGPSSRKPVGDLNDFKLVAYQGDAVLGGRESSLARVFEQGKPVVLNFWAGQCPPCQAEMPMFQRVADEYAGKVVFVGVDVGVFTGLGTHEDARRLLMQLNMRYPSAYAVDPTPLRLYNVQGMPTTIFFTAKGEISDRATGMLLERDLRGKVQTLVDLSR